jgi:hypothetical protein
MVYLWGYNAKFPSSYGGCAEVWSLLHNLGCEMVNYKREEKLLSYWQGRYLFQLFLVCFIGIAFAISVLFYAKFLLLKVLFLLLDVFVLRLMILALNEGIQYRGERAFFSNLKDMFDELVFDYGKGIDEDVLVQQNVIGEYQVHECRNVLKGDGFIIEEDWFYNVSTIKSIAINDTIFLGVVCAYDVEYNDELRGRVELKGKALLIEGSVSAIISSEYKEKLSKLLKLFKAKEAKLVLTGGKLYVWIATRSTIFYQFDMVQKGKMREFESRIHLLNFRF